MSPAYDYQCSSCDQIWEETHPMKDYKLPCDLPCPHCSSKGKEMVKRVITSCPAVVHDITGPIDRMSNGFNDVLKRIKKNAGAGDTIRLK